MSKRWWVSFSAEDTGNRGLVLTEFGKDEKSVLESLSERGLNPGGQAMMICLPRYGSNLEVDVQWNKLPKETLITPEEALNYGYKAHTQDESDNARRLVASGKAKFVCQDCNE